MPRRVVDSAERCYARSWSGGKGGQCGSKRVDGSDYCTRHLKQAEVTYVPCSFTEDGKRRTGLHFGDIRDEVQWRAPDGTVAIVWDVPEIRAEIIAAMDAGATYHPSSGEGKAAAARKKTKDLRAVVAQKATALAKAVKETKEIDEQDKLQANISLQLMLALLLLVISLLLTVNIRTYETRTLN